MFTEGSKARSIALDFCGLVLIFYTFFIETCIPLKEVSLRYQNCCNHLKLLILNAQKIFQCTRHFLSKGKTFSISRGMLMCSVSPYNCFCALIKKSVNIFVCCVSKVYVFQAY